ncbi:MAG: phosphoglycolate phosphatase [Candidatus Azotimanducaceae bacterium]|jgi:phosphoglycolate phosphatase
MPQPIEIAIFDLDGTLLDTLDSLAKAFNLALCDIDCPNHDVQAYKLIIGDGARVAAQRALPADRQGDDHLDACVARFKHHYDQSWQTAVPYGGIVAVLNELKGQIPLAVLSNKDQVFTSQCVDYFFPDMFDTAVGFSEHVKHKPDPSGAIQVAAKLGSSTARACMIGDTATDMNTAVACDMTGIGVLWGFRDQNELEQSGALHIIHTPDALIPLILNQ